MTAGRAHVVLKGGGLSSGREGTFVFDLAVELKGDEVPVNALEISGRFIAAMDTPCTFARLATQVEAAATGAQFLNGVKLAADLAAARASTGKATRSRSLTVPASSLVSKPNSLGQPPPFGYLETGPA